MAIYGVGAYHESDISSEFITNEVIFLGWGPNDAPGLHQWLASLRVGDIVYIKAFPPGAHEIKVRGIGLITSSEVVQHNNCAGRRVRWLHTDEFTLPQPAEKNNVLGNNHFWFHKRSAKKSLFGFRIADEHIEDVSQLLDEKNISFVQKRNRFKITCDAEFITTNQELLRKIGEFVKKTWKK